VQLPSACALERRTGGSCVITGVGADWFSVSTGCAHCHGITLYQSLLTGAARSSAGVRTATTAPDLNAPELARSICSPVTAQQGTTVRFAGQFIVQQHRDALMAQRCGRSLPLIAVTGVGVASARPHLLAWTRPPLGLKAACLPSGKRLDLSTPPGVTNIVDVSVAFNRIIVTGQRLDGTTRLYSAPWPRC
jgi:hypothetical protein